MKGFVIQDGMFKLADLHENLNARIERLLTVPVDSMYGFLNLGSRMLDYFHLASTPETAAAILLEIKTLINVFEPSIKLINLSAIIRTPNNSASDYLEIELEYEVGGQISTTRIINTKPAGEN